METLKRLKVLLVEDEVNLANLLNKAIGENFGKFIIAHDGLSGLELYKKEKPHIILSDITMPKMGGLEMARKIHAINLRVPIIILSAYSNTEIFLNAIESRVIKYFIKPFDIDELLAFLIEISHEVIYENTLKLGYEFSFDILQNRLYKAQQIISLTKREILFFDYLLKDKNRFISVNELKIKLWNDINISDESLRTFIKRIRQKTTKRLILNNPTLGYKLEC